MPDLFLKIRRKRHIYLARRRIRSSIIAVSKVSELKLNIGSSTVNYDGWINLDLPYFDLRSAELWKFYFKNTRIDKILMEHVLEHLTPDEVTLALKLASPYLKKSHNIRIAVPDKNHPNPLYIEHVSPGGTGPGAIDHKSFWCIDTLSALANSLGYVSQPIEYYDKSGVLNSASFDDAFGLITRTALNPRNGALADYSSLIIDLKLQ